MRDTIGGLIEKGAEECGQGTADQCSGFERLMSRQVLPIVPPVLDCPLAVSSFRGPWCDPSPPGESERLRTRYGDPVENLARLHATPCRAKFTGAKVIHKRPFDLVGIEGA